MALLNNKGAEAPLLIHDFFDNAVFVLATRTDLVHRRQCVVEGKGCRLLAWWKICECLHELGR